MEVLFLYILIIIVLVILILLFFFGELLCKISIFLVFMFIILGILFQFGMDLVMGQCFDFLFVLKVFGIVGLIMIVLEVVLEFEFKLGKYLFIVKVLFIVFIGLLVSVYVVVFILYQFVFGMDMVFVWFYVMLFFIFFSVIIIFSVMGFKEEKKEFYIYESIFLDILGIMVFYFLSGNIEVVGYGSGLVEFFGNLVFIIVIVVVVSYLIIFIF